MPSNAVSENRTPSMHVLIFLLTRRPRLHPATSSKLPARKSTAAFALEFEALVRATHRIVIQPLHPPIAASKTDIVESRDSQTTPAIVEGRMLRVDELWLRFRIRRRYRVSSESMRIVDVVFPILPSPLRVHQSVWRSRCRTQTARLAIRTKRFDKTSLFPPHKHPLPPQPLPPPPTRQRAYNIFISHVHEWRQLAPIQGIVRRGALEALGQKGVRVEVEDLAFEVRRYAAGACVARRGWRGVVERVLVWM